VLQYALERKSGRDQPETSRWSAEAVLVVPASKRSSHVFSKKHPEKRPSLSKCVRPHSEKKSTRLLEGIGRRFPDKNKKKIKKMKAKKKKKREKKTKKREEKKKNYYHTKNKS